MTFFFDGIPPSDTIQYDQGKENENENEDGVSEKFRASPIVTDNDFIVHYPYKEGECFSCHDENSRSELVLKEPDLCYMCHEDFSGIFKSVHGPVSGGYCTSCHNAHMSKEKNLLIRNGQQICLFCHESKDVFKNETHMDIADTECTLCHNPHGGEDRFILN